MVKIFAFSMLTFIGVGCTNLGLPDVGAVDATFSCAACAEGFVCDPMKQICVKNAAVKADAGTALQDAATKPIVKVDFLWVIDHSPSMAQQQVNLAKSFDALLAGIQAGAQLDAQMAVVTVQQIADSGTQGNIKVIGQFNRRAATDFPPNAIERSRLPCLSDDDCANPDGFDYNFALAEAITACSSLCPQPPADKSAYKRHFTNPQAGKDWHCHGLQSAKVTSNDNCSVNSYCWKHCTSGPSDAQKAAGDQECRAAFEAGVPADKQRSICFVPGGSAYEAAGCMFPPLTADCPLNPATGKPDNLPAVLTQQNLNLFHCIAAVAASPTQEASFEGGLRSAWLALDPKGPNCANGAGSADCQNTLLLRPDAYLAIVFVSDDDDCSVALDLALSTATADDKSALSKLLPKEDWDKCQKLGDAVGGNEALNDGNCEYMQAKMAQSKPTCTSDCAKIDPAGARDAYKACVNQVAADKDKYAMVDKRFAAVGDFVTRFKSLKTDPSHVVVAAITGVSTAASQAQQQCDAVNYYRAALRNQGPGQSPYVCAGARGESGYGSRYIQLVNAFGDRGILQNICNGTDFVPALQAIAAGILQAAGGK